MTERELARLTGTHERYAIEGLDQQTITGIRTASRISPGVLLAQIWSKWPAGWFQDVSKTFFDQRPLSRKLPPLLQGKRQ
ncbi:MAG: hypothetical protein ACOC9Y_02520 [Chloroflexota bacterium]